MTSHDQVSSAQYMTRSERRWMMVRHEAIRGALWSIAIGLGLLIAVACHGYECDYDPDLCDWIPANLNPPFTVPAGGSVTITQDMTHCVCAVGDKATADIVNFQIVVLNERGRWPKATMEVYDQTGELARRCYTFANQHGVNIGTVPPRTTYYIVVTSGSRQAESCIVQFSGSTWGSSYPACPRSGIVPCDEWCE